MPQDDHPPAIMMYVRDLLSDSKVEPMTTQEFGAYMLLLLRSWHEKPVATIPTDTRVLRAWTRLTAEQWTECQTAVLACFKPHGEGRMIQPRLAKEYQKFMESKKRRSRAGKKGAESRWGGDDGNAMANASDCYGNRMAMPSQSHGIQPNNPITQ